MDGNGGRGSRTSLLGHAARFGVRTCAVVVCATVISVVVMVVVMMYRRAHHEDPRQRGDALPHFYTSIDLDEVCELTGLSFPPSARLLNGRYYGLNRTTTLAKIALDPTEVDEFLDALPEGPEALPRDEFMGWMGVDYDSPSWWDPDSATKAILRTASVSYLVVKLDDPQRPVVYVCQTL